MLSPFKNYSYVQSFVFFHGIEWNLNQIYIKQILNRKMITDQKST